MKKKFIFGLIVCVLCVTLLSNFFIKVKASSNELSISPMYVPTEKIDSVKSLISDIELELSKKDTDITLELSKFKKNCQELLNTNYNRNLENLIDEIDYAILGYSEYKSEEQLRGKYHLKYNTAIAAITAGFIFNGWKLSAELLLHAKDNDVLYSKYYPVFGENIGYSKTYQDLVKDETVSGTKEFYEPNFLNFTNYDEDSYYAIHGFNYQKKYYNDSQINIVIHDIYDFAKDKNDGLTAFFNNVCYDAQMAGVLVPYFVVIDLISNGNIPFKYTINGNNISIDKYLSDNVDFIIPETIDNHNLLYEVEDPVKKYTIKTISENAFQNANISSIVIPKTVTNIDSNAFEGCTNLEKIEIPASVEYIGSNVFKNCSVLKSIKFKREISEITSIGENVFAGCTSLTEIIVPQNRIAEYKNHNNFITYKDKIISDNDIYEEINLNCSINDSLNIDLNPGYNKLYKLNVECDKSYKFESSSNIKLKIYDDNFNEVANGENVIYSYLNKGTYYLDVRYISNNESGTIILNYGLRWNYDGERIYCNEEINLLPHLHKNSNGFYLNKMYYFNDRGPSFYKFTLSGIDIRDIPIIFKEGTLKIYNNSDRIDSQLLNKYPNSSIRASSKYNQSEMYTYLPRDGYFYINITMPLKIYKTLNLIITPIECETINLISNMTSTFTNNLTFENNQEEYAKKLVIEQTSKYSFNINSNEILTNNFNIVIFKQTYDSSNNSYYTNFENIDYIVNGLTQKTFEVSLDSGIYFIYYYNNDTKVNIDLDLTRIVQDNSNIEYSMQADPFGAGLNSGSEVRFNNGAKNNYTITEGFTRNIYFVSGDFYGYSRLEFDWYSSNENIATVSCFGTVFAKNVSSNQTVTIYAVYRADPSLICYRVFDIIEDLSTEKIVINSNMSYSYLEENGSYKLVLDDTNCPYPMIQYYNWSVYVPCQESDITCSMNTWGEITTSGPGRAILTGTYIINPRVTIKINLIITE